MKLNRDHFLAAALLIGAANTVGVTGCKSKTDSASPEQANEAPAAEGAPAAETPAPAAETPAPAAEVAPPPARETVVQVPVAKTVATPTPKQLNAPIGRAPIPRTHK